MWGEEGKSQVMSWVDENNNSEGGLQVVLSDYDDEGMKADLERNVANALPPALRAHASVIPHTWGTSPDRVIVLRQLTSIFSPGSLS